MTTWLVLDVDNGVLGAFATRKEAVAAFAWGPVVERHQYGAGSYEYVTGWGDDTNNFNVDTLAAARRAEFPGIDQWEKAGCPMGRFTEPYNEERS